MKKIFCLVMLICLALSVEAQINVKDRVKNRSRNRAENKVDNTIDNGLDKIENGVEGLFKKKKKKSKDDSDDNNSDNNNNQNNNNNNSNNNSNAGSSTATTLKSYSKYDFVSGEKVVAYEDFSQDAIGDFPAKWNTNSSAEIVTIGGKEGKWLQMNGKGIFYPEYIQALPENFTLEFNIASSEEFSYYCEAINLYFVSKQNNYLAPERNNGVLVEMHPYTSGKTGSSRITTYDANRKEVVDNSRQQSQYYTGSSCRVSVWRQKTRLRVYLNEEKIWDIPRAFADGVEYRLIFTGGGCESSTPYLNDMKLAVGQPDTRSKLITEGKLVTRGILFSSGSNKIKPESYGTLKDIAQVLTENAGVKVKIVGHTDADGDTNTNLQLSKQRADAVKEALTKEFGIAANRMETEGKGESEPTDDNNTSIGKANNRRVEFIKL